METEAEVERAIGKSQCETLKSKGYEILLGPGEMYEKSNLYNAEV